MFFIMIKAQGEWYFASENNCTSDIAKAKQFVNMREGLTWLVCRSEYLGNVNATFFRMLAAE